MSYRRVLSCSPSVRIDRSARPLLAELCRGEVSCPAISLPLSLPPAMIEGSLSQRSLNLPTSFSRSLPPSSPGNLWLLLSFACAQCSSRRLPELSPYRHRLPSARSHCELPGNGGPLVAFRSRTVLRCHVPVCGFPPRSWEERDFLRSAYSVGSLEGLWCGWVSCAFHVTSSVQQRFVEVSTFNHFFLSQMHGATFELLFPILVLVTLATAVACPQLVKNCPSIQLMTHEVRELSRSLVWSDLSLIASGNPSTTGNKSCISIASSFSRRVSFGVHSERILNNVQRYTTMTCRHFAASRFRFKPVTLFDQLSHAEDRSIHVRDSELCTHTLTFTFEPHVHSPRTTSFDHGSLCIIERATLGWSLRCS